MKGIFFTIITFLIFAGIAVFVSTIASTNIEKATQVNNKIAADRIYYHWNDIKDHLLTVLNLNISEDHNSNITQINDSLPAEIDINNFLKLYQNFVNNTMNDTTIPTRFETPSGNPMNLEDLDPTTFFNILPMGVNYGYPTFGKNRLNVSVTPANFSFINNITIKVKMKNVDFKCSPITDNPQPCEKWTPSNNVSTCSGVAYCANVTLVFEDRLGRTYNFFAKLFDVEAPKKSTGNLNVNNTTSAYSIDIQLGPLPTVVNIDLHNTQVDTAMQIGFNTTDFYVNIATILNVSTVYGKKVANI